MKASSGTPKTDPDCMQCESAAVDRSNFAPVRRYNHACVCCAERQQLRHEKSAKKWRRTHNAGGTFVYVTVIDVEIMCLCSSTKAAFHGTCTLISMCHKHASSLAEYHTNWNMSLATGKHKQPPQHLTSHRLTNTSCFRPQGCSGSVRSTKAHCMDRRTS